MDQHQGFSLIEVLLSLMLASVTSLALLQHQWQSTRLFNQIHLHAQALAALDDATESWMAYLKPVLHEAPPFKMTLDDVKPFKKISVRWQENTGSGLEERQIKRSFFGN